MDPKSLEWARRLQALAQTGLTYATGPFDTERYTELREIAAEMMAEASGEELGAVRARFTAQSGYATPKVDVRGVVFKNAKILLVKELRDGAWTLPGGWADVGDTPSEAVVREIFEESGYETRAMKVLAVWDRRLHGHAPPDSFHIYKIFMLCELTGGQARDSVETAGAAFFAENEIPPLSLGRVTPEQIVRLFDHARHPELPTDFD